MSDSAPVPTNGQGKEGDRQTKPHGPYGNVVGSRPWSQRRVVIGLYFGGEMALRGRCKLLCDRQGGKEEGKEQKRSFLKKGRNLTSAWRVRSA